MQTWARPLAGLARQFLAEQGLLHSCQVTTAAAVIFMITSLLLATLGKGKNESIMDGAKVKVPTAQEESASGGAAEPESK